MWRGYIQHGIINDDAGVRLLDHIYCSEACYWKHVVSQPIEQHIGYELTCETNYDLDNPMHMVLVQK